MAYSHLSARIYKKIDPYAFAMFFIEQALKVCLISKIPVKIDFQSLPLLFRITVT